MKLFALVALGAVAGAVVGGTGVLCPDGSCSITGSWYGTGTVGGLLGFAASGFLPGRVVLPEDDGDDAPAERDAD